MKQLLPKVTERLHPFKDAALRLQVPSFPMPANEVDQSDKITQAWFWPRISKFLRPKDVLVAETGTSSFAILDIPFPEESVFLAQLLWGSIGWSVGSTLGAALAAQEVGLGRTILFIGDGSL